MTIAPSTTTKRKHGRPKKQATPEASREAYDSTKGQSRNPIPESNASLATKESTAKGSNASNASTLASSEGQAMGQLQATVQGRGQAMGPQTLPPFPPFRVRGVVLTPRQYVNSLAPELLEAWAAHFIATGKRQDWLFSVAPHFGRENNRYRSEIVREIETQQVTQAELLRLKTEEVMSDLDRRRKLKAIANEDPHPMKGWADNLKAIELDARHDPESCMSKASREQSQATLPPINLFFLPQGAARPMQVATAAQHTIELAGPEAPPHGGG